MSDDQDFVRDFLYGAAELRSDAKTLTASVFMDERTEGWIGIPHGGISMGIFADMALSLNSLQSVGERLFPLKSEFRLGGARLRIGDHLHFRVEPGDHGANGEAAVQGEPIPYMSASIEYGKDDACREDLFASCMPEHVDDVMNRLTLLPSYKNCFVCGFERHHPGLRRQFHLWDSGRKIVIAHAGFRPEDSATFYRFQNGGYLHPLPFMALLDETMGWAGFLMSSSGGVTVQISFTIYRPVSVDEKLIFFGRGDRLRGKTGSRLLFWASGGAGAVREDGSLEMVASSSGQWYGIQDLTEQMKTALLPEELMKRAFSFSEQR
jgi:acyl-coenzyme A thioesterase PaaI-like protein